MSYTIGRVRRTDCGVDLWNLFKDGVECDRIPTLDAPRLRRLADDLNGLRAGDPCPACRHVLARVSGSLGCSQCGWRGPIKAPGLGREPRAKR